jgi:hypothetical protein
MLVPDQRSGPRANHWAMCPAEWWLCTWWSQNKKRWLEALLGFGGEHGLGERVLFMDFWQLGAAKSPLYCVYVVYLGTGY